MKLNIHPFLASSLVLLLTAASVPGAPGKQAARSSARSSVNQNSSSNRNTNTNVNRNSRVGERATLCGATHSPLVEPDKRMSRHPALLKTSRLRHAQAVARLPASTALPAPIAGFADRN